MAGKPSPVEIVLKGVDRVTKKGVVVGASRALTVRLPRPA